MNSHNDNEFTDILRVQGVNAKGYGILPKIPMQDLRLTPTAKLIYAYFCSFAGAGDIAFPSVKKIMKDLGIKDIDTFRKHRKRLEYTGYIKVEQATNKGVFGSNIYTLISNPEAITIDICESSPIPKKPVTGKNRNGKNPLPKKPVTKSNSIYKSNSINKNNTHSTKALCVEIQNTLGEKIGDSKIKELIKQKGADKVREYISNWDKYRNHAKTTQAQFFVFAVSNELPEPQEQQRNVQSHNNFDQRQYTEKDLEKYYVDVSQ